MQLGERKFPEVIFHALTMSQNSIWLAATVCIVINHETLDTNSMHTRERIRARSSLFVLKLTDRQRPPGPTDILRTLPIYLNQLMESRSLMTNSLLF